MNTFIFFPREIKSLWYRLKNEIFCRSQLPTLCFLVSFCKLFYESLSHLFIYNQTERDFFQMFLNFLSRGSRGLSIKTIYLGSSRKGSHECLVKKSCKGFMIQEIPVFLKSNNINEEKFLSNTSKSKSTGPNFVIKLTTKSVNLLKTTINSAQSS